MDNLIKCFYLWSFKSAPSYTFGKIYGYLSFVEQDYFKSYVSTLKASSI